MVVIVMMIPIIMTVPMIKITIKVVIKIMVKVMIKVMLMLPVIMVYKLMRMPMLIIKVRVRTCRLWWDDAYSGQCDDRKSSNELFLHVNFQY